MKLRVAYAKSSYKGKTYITPLVVTSYRDEHGVSRNKTIVSLAKLPPHIVSLIDAALKQGDSASVAEMVPLDSITYSGSIVVGPAFVALSLIKQLGIYNDLYAALPPQQAFAALNIIVERITAAKPLSVAAQHRRCAREPLMFLTDAGTVPSQSRWYAALSTLEEHREHILQSLFERTTTPRDLYLYDITSSYFEGDTCPLAEYGYNRDKKKGKKQVVLGIICDRNGCPIWMDVFKGNTADQTTVKQQLIDLHTKLGLDGFTFVGDRGMLTHARIEELEQEGWWESFTYITALTRQEMMAFVEDDTHPIQLALFDHQRLVEVEQDGIRYVLCHNPEREQRDRQTRLRLLELTEEKLEALRKNVQAGRVKNEAVIARRLYKWINHWRMERFFSVTYETGKFSFARCDEEIERYARLDGCYVIRSNVPTQKNTTDELRERYKHLQYVEQAFRTMKTTDIQTRPIRHFNVMQVRGHIFACFLAYRVIWELRQRLAPVLDRDPDNHQCAAGSLAEVWRDLADVTVARLEVDGVIHLKLSQITPDVQHLLELCQVQSLETLTR